MEYLTEYHVQLIISYLCLFYFMVPTYSVLKLRKKANNQHQKPMNLLLFSSTIWINLTSFKLVTILKK